MILREFEDRKLVQPPAWLTGNTIYLVRMGSMAFGVANDRSDIDIQGIAVPPIEMVFPTIAGEIPGFGAQRQPFMQWTRHHVPLNDASHDFTIWGIVRFFDLLLTCNANIIEPLFVNPNLVMYETPVSKMITNERRSFITMQIWRSFFGNANANLSRIVNKRMSRFVALCRLAGIENWTMTTAETMKHMLPGGTNALLPNLGSNEVGEFIGLLREADRDGGWNKRLPQVAKNGYDVRYAYHLVRLLLECEQMLRTGDLDLESNADTLHEVRAGEWPLQRVHDFFRTKSAEIEDIKARSTIPEIPDEARMRRLLMACLEEHYGGIGPMLRV